MDRESNSPKKERNQMKTNLLLIFAAVATCAFGGEKATDTGINDVIVKLGDLGRASAMAPRALTRHDAAPTYDGSSVRMVVAASYTIQPGDNFDSGQIPIDFGGADNLAIALTSPSSDLSGIGIGVTWAAPSEYFVLTDIILGGTLTGGTGGMRVPVYGPALRILVVNTGKTPITIKQMSIYACIH
jgi:hypothetical protein